MNNKLKIANYIKLMVTINTLLKFDTNRDDTLIKLYYELLDIIFYGTPDAMITYTKKVYDINIPVSSYDTLGSKIKNFILLYLNDAIEVNLIDYEL